MGLKQTRATGTTDVWFKALGTAPNFETFHRQTKTPFGLSSPRDIGRLLEKISKGEAVSAKASDQMLQMMRDQVYSSRLPRYVTGSAFRTKPAISCHSLAMMSAFSKASRSIS